MLLKATDKQHYNEKIPKDRDRKKLQRAIVRQQVWMLFFELANVKLIYFHIFSYFIF